MDTPNPKPKPDPIPALLIQYEQAAQLQEHMNRIAAFQACDPRFNDYDRAFLSAARINPA